MHERLSINPFLLKNRRTSFVKVLIEFRAQFLENDLQREKIKIKVYFLLYITDLHVTRLKVFSDFLKVTF